MTSPSQTSLDPALSGPLSRGKKNDISDVPGIQVGAAHDQGVKTGVSVILPSAPMICAGDVRGGGPGTRETDLLQPDTLVTTADAIVLSGGSSYGLAAADGVAALLGAEGRGFSLVNRPGVPPSPIVPSAILYDLANGGDKGWKEQSPYERLGREALLDAKKDHARVAQGAAGAGYGAMAGSEKGGLGSASIMGEGVLVGALMAVNSFGSTRMPGSDAFWAWPFEIDGEFGNLRPDVNKVSAMGLPSDTKLAAANPRHNTTIGVVALSVPMTQAQAKRIAVMAQDGFARAIRPVHAPTDGDVIFVLAPESDPSTPISQLPNPLLLTRLGNMAADCVARAIARGVYEANQ